MCASSKSPIELRRFGRRVCCKPAVAVQNLTVRLRCTIIDISEGGARLRLASVNELAAEFLLVVPEDDLVYDCRVVHRHADFAGVEFTRPPRRLSRMIERGKS